MAPTSAVSPARTSTARRLRKGRGRADVVAGVFEPSASDSQPAVNAKDRIGTGPWHNAKGVAVAQNVADLHSDTNLLSKENSLTEKGASSTDEATPRTRMTS